ncbi:hypothetical protein [Actinoplanes sp. NBRC 103695]|uniref:hypothetical protein n=1 Tax=Actinoplanes sp. NBRC 103695 TaxID=3032202 RepID=UPI0025525821|nr:hypothetical protein [Actinoplanes sp. NBRC 103695]
MRRLMVLLAVLLVAGCQKEGTTVEVKSRAEVETVIRAQAGELPGEVDGLRLNSAPCGNGDTWNLTGIGAIPLAAEKHVATLRAVKERWQADGWQIDDDRTLPDGVRGSLSGVTPDGALTVSLTSSQPPRQLAVIIASRCYRPAPGEDPANQ